MLKVKQIVTPSPQQWDIVIHGARSAFESWDKSDSELCSPSEHYNENCDKRCTFMWTGECDDPWITPGFILGEKDENLLKSLCKFGSSDRKLLRQLPIIMEIKAPEYWYRQFDTYKIGTTANSTSQMHALFKDGFDQSDFSFLYTLPYIEDNVIDELNTLREFYLHEQDEDTKKEIWFRALEIIPQSFNYTRTVSLNYEVALNMTMQRYNHELKEWHTLIQYFIDKLPYFTTILDAVNLTEELKKNGYDL